MDATFPFSALLAVPRQKPATTIIILNTFIVVLMAIVDDKDRFIWASVGFPGNSHNFVIFQSTYLWHTITENSIIPSISQVIEGTNVHPMILGDSAFP